MTVTRRSLLRTAGALAALPLLPAQAQDWPTRPIRIIVGTAAGGSPDIVSRLLGEKLSRAARPDDHDREQHPGRRRGRRSSWSAARRPTAPRR